MSNNTMHEELVREYAQLQDDVAAPLARMDDIKKVLRDLDYGKHELAGLEVQVSRNSRLNAKAFADRYPVTQHPEFYKTAPDTKEIRRHLAPKEVESLSTEGDKRVTIK